MFKNLHKKFAAATYLAEGCVLMHRPRWNRKFFYFLFGHTDISAVRVVMAADCALENINSK
jgi:hypothetical protein